MNATYDGRPRTSIASLGKARRMTGHSRLPNQMMTHETLYEYKSQSTT